MKTLGIDLGSNSLGWAVLGQDKIEHTGVVIFEEGIVREKGVDSIETPAAIRRGFRMARRIKQRRKYRKFHILKLLIEQGMCPLTEEEYRNWKQHEVYPSKNELFRAWIASGPDGNPYADRAAAAERKVDALTLGRALYHLAQRRGFKSSRKDTDEDGDGKKAKEQGKVKAEIAELTHELEQRGNCTLGQYFYELYQAGKKIRNRHTGRIEHYQVEFDRIATVQKLSTERAEQFRKALFDQRPLRSQHHLVGTCPLEKGHSCALSSDPLFEAFRMYSVINNIRLTSADGVVRSLTPEERRSVQKAFYVKAPSFEFGKIRKLLFPKKADAQKVEFNYRDDKSLSSCPVSHQLNELFGMPYQEWHYEYVAPDGTRKIRNWRTVFDALIFFEDNTMLQTFGRDKLGFNAEQIEKLIKIRFREGYAKYSLRAIRRILPFLENGCELSIALILAKIPEILGLNEYRRCQQEILHGVLECFAEYRTAKRCATQEHPARPLGEKLEEFFEDTLGFTPDQFYHLYSHKPDSVYDSATARKSGVLPTVKLGMLRNPLVQRSMTILRRLVNDLRKRGFIDADTRIHLELARNVNDRNTRMAWEQWQKNRENERLAAVESLKPYTENPSDDLILRTLLWQEQGGTCLYTGRQFGLQEIVSGQSGIDIEHTVPRSRSGDDSMSNKTLCDANFNRNIKKGRLPVECPDYGAIEVRLRAWREKLNTLEKDFARAMKSAKNAPDDNPEAKAKLRQKALVLKFDLIYWRKKLYLFDMKKDDLAGGTFLNRQLVDTGIMTRHALEFLRCVYPETYAVNGTAVDWAGKAWGVRKISEKKARVDHTHHAIDAMVIAALDRSRFNQICTMFRDNEEKTYDALNSDSVVPPPFNHFSDAVFDASENILIKHLTRHHELKQTWKEIDLAKVRHLADGSEIKRVASAGDTVRGQLHAESFYGKITNPGSGGEQKFVIRKFINDEKCFKSIDDFYDKIVDRAVAHTVAEQVRDYLEQGLSFSDAIAHPLWMKFPAGDIPGVPILKVRIFAKPTDPLVVRKHTATPSANPDKNNVYVTSCQGSNFRLAVYRETDGTGAAPQLNFVLDNLLVWAQTHKDPAYLTPEKRTDSGEFIGFVYPGSLALLYEKDPAELRTMTPRQLSKRLYKVRKFVKNQMTFYFHREARDIGTLGHELVAMGKNQAGQSKPDFQHPHEMLLLSPSTYSKYFLFENIHFKLNLDGSVSWLD